MEKLLLETKLFIPPTRKRLVDRSRLIQRFTDSYARKLTLIVAPAGFGKTTLSSAWLTGQSIPVAWVSLDQSDNDPVLFFSYCLTALHKIDGQIGRAGLEMLQSPEPSAPQYLMTSLINDLTQVNRKVVLALDDYHLIEAEAIHAALTFLIENQPPQLHLTIISRSEPPLPVAKLRAKNQLVEIGPQDLRFSQAEAVQFLNELMHLNLSLDDAAELERQTEGWVTGLQLAALWLQHVPSTAQVITQLSGDNRFIADYLVDEVLSQQTAETQQFLLYSSILDELSADLCNELLQRSDSQMVLEQVERSNLFLIPLDNARQWYRYHHLFADLLRSRLHQLHPDIVPELYGRAFAWHHANGRLEAAVRYALQGEMIEQAAELIEVVGLDIYWRNRSHTLQAWLQELPASIYTTRPNLHVLWAYTDLDRGDMRAAERTLNRLEATLQQHPLASSDEQRLVEGRLAAARTAVAYHTYLDGARGYQLAQQALEKLPANYTYERGVAAFHGAGSLVLLGELNEAREYLHEALELVEYTDNQQNQARILVLSNLGYLEMVAGALRRASGYFHEARQYAHEINVRQASTYSSAVSGLANLHYEWNELETADTYIQEAVQLVERDTFLDRILLAYRVWLRLQVARGQFSEAHATVRRAHHVADEFNAPRRVRERIGSLEAVVALAEGDGGKTAVWAEQFSAQFDGQVSYEYELELLTFCKILIAQNEIATAVNWLNQLLVLARKQVRLRSMIRIQILLAKAYALAGDQSAASDQLTQALLLAEPERFVRAFVSPGEPIKRLLLDMQAADETDGQAPTAVYIQTLLDAFPVETGTPSPASMAPDAFTARELDVLRVLAKGLSYADIGKALAISENTVRTHIKSIYRKTDSHNRTQVLLRARELELI